MCVSMWLCWQVPPHVEVGFSPVSGTQPGLLNVIRWCQTYFPLLDCQSTSIFSSLEIQDFFIIPGNITFRCSLSFPGGSDGKVSAYNVEDQGSTPGSERSGEGNWGGAVKALSPKARPFCDRQVVPTEGGLRGSLLHAVPVP